MPPRGFIIGGACVRCWIGAFFESSRGPARADAPRGRAGKRGRGAGGTGAPSERLRQRRDHRDPLYVKAHRDVVLGSCATADCLVNGRIAGQKAAAAEPVA